MTQQTGIPIGGSMSGVMLKISLAAVEHLFDTELFSDWVAGGSLDSSRASYISVCRYVDDLAVMSRWFCGRCIRSFVDSVYKGVVTFEDSMDGSWCRPGFMSARFLDFYIFMTADSVECHYWNKNEIYALTGISFEISKYRYQLPYGDRATMVKRLTSDMQGRLARHRQMDCSDGLRIAWGLELSEIIRIGYPLNVIQTALEKTFPITHRYTAT